MHAAVLLAFSLVAAAADALVVETPVGAEPVRVGAGWLSDASNDYNLSIDADSRLLVFGRSTSGDFQDAKAWIAAREGEGWSTPVLAPFSDPRWRDSDPWLTPDGRWLYFVSNRPAPGREGRDDLDLWRAPIVAGRIGALEHLAAASSPGEELGPEVHGGVLVFNSTREGGPARLALYRARIDRGVTAAEPMPAPFNEGLAQGDLTFSPDGGVALFWSIRGESRDPDLFMARRQGDDWGPARRLPAPYNGPGMDFTPAFSADGARITWASQRTPAGDGVDPARRADVYVAEREGMLREP
jgi:hypothetical protein